MTQLTPEGEEFLSRAAIGRTRNAEKVFASLDDEEQRQFRILSRKVIDALTGSVSGTFKRFYQAT